MSLPTPGFQPLASRTRREHISVTVSPSKWGLDMAAKKAHPAFQRWSLRHTDAGSVGFLGCLLSTDAALSLIVSSCGWA